ncbi:hypothetical protein [Novosphingobium mangrovi (ex Hu et al. 2023)]|uniref:Uncharacterized protein n=1 Tax=Novosphingobium mangrovi (ex Hu et al. 2023) TaxID=2930094 RepID=A0ABT0A7S9_9SPHN|nr:hypothetical protein [Novosphingobium mangrovi (ex Hu et al. 2023)]MCJ1959252.1 hypothetical protein [Novosphingobium mangrovi (ex Hu et al. 2023)]
MKANPRGRALPVRLVSAPALALTLFAAGCIPAPPASTPTPTPSATRPAQPQVQEPAIPAPPPSPRPLPEPANWRDAPVTPGTWSWAQSGPRSVADFGGSLFTMRCDTRNATVTLERRAQGAAGRVTMGITTMQDTHTVTAEARQGYYVATLPARSPILDDMAFTRGRFALSTQGQPTLYIPSWTEVSRVIEDCR